MGDVALRRIRCTNCGADFSDISPGQTVFVCRRAGCGASFLLSQGEAFASVEVQRAEVIINHRQALRRALENRDSDSIGKYASVILGMIPKDFRANLAMCLKIMKQGIGDPRPLRKFLDSVNEGTASEFLEMLPFALDYAGYFELGKLETAAGRYLSEDALMLAREQIERQRHLLEQKNEDYADVPRDVFICHSSQNIEEAEAAYCALREDGWRVWMSTHNLDPDCQYYWESIERAIRQCRVILVVCTKQAMQSYDVQREMRMAREAHRIRMEFKVDDAPHTTFFKDFFDGITWIDARGSMDSALDRLKLLVMKAIYPEPEPPMHEPETAKPEPVPPKPDPVPPKPEPVPPKPEPVPPKPEPVPPKPEPVPPKPEPVPPKPEPATPEHSKMHIAEILVTVAVATLLIWGTSVAPTDILEIANSIRVGSLNIPYLPISAFFITLLTFRQELGRRNSSIYRSFLSWRFIVSLLLTSMVFALNFMNFSYLKLLFGARNYSENAWYIANLSNRILAAYHLLITAQIVMLLDNPVISRKSNSIIRLVTTSIGLAIVAIWTYVVGTIFDSGYADFMACVLRDMNLYFALPILLCGLCLGVATIRSTIRQNKRLLTSSLVLLIIILICTVTITFSYRSNAVVLVGMLFEYALVALTEVLEQRFRENGRQKA